MTVLGPVRRGDLRGRAPDSVRADRFGLPRADPVYTIRITHGAALTGGDGGADERNTVATTGANGTNADTPHGEAHVCIQLQNDGVSRDDLEAHAFEVLEVLERDADVALGAVVACDFEAGAIEVEFDVAASTGSEFTG